MNSFNFHIHGDVNISFHLPVDTAGNAPPDESYQKLVDSLEDFLHDAADEVDAEPDDVDSIVMVMRPDSTPEVMLESDCYDRIESRGCYDCMKVLSDQTLDVDGLLIVFDGSRVLKLGDERYLLGPVIVYSCDVEGDGVSLSADEVIAAVVYFADHTVTLCGDGKDFKAFRI